MTEKIIFVLKINRHGLRFQIINRNFQIAVNLRLEMVLRLFSANPWILVESDAQSKEHSIHIHNTRSMTPRCLITSSPYSKTSDDLNSSRLKFSLLQILVTQEGDRPCRTSQFATRVVIFRLLSIAYHFSFLVLGLTFWPQFSPADFLLVRFPAVYWFATTISEIRYHTFPKFQNL